MCCWFYVTATSAPARCLMALDNSTGTNFYSISINGANITSVFLNANTTINNTVTSGNGSFSLNAWNHCAAIFSSSTSRELYLNGTSYGVNTDLAAPSVALFKIGARTTNGVVGLYHNGLVADAGVYSAALTAEEIASLAKGMTCDKIRPQSLVFYAPLVRDLIDVKGGLTITNNNSATVANHPRVYS
jgi:hypothetical protein